MADVLAQEGTWRARGEHAAGEEDLFGIPFRVEAYSSDQGLREVRYESRSDLGRSKSYWATVDHMREAFAARFGDPTIDQTLILQNKRTWTGDGDRKAVEVGDGSWLSSWFLAKRTRVDITLAQGRRPDRSAGLVIQLSYVALEEAFPEPDGLPRVDPAGRAPWDAAPEEPVAEQPWLRGPLEDERAAGGKAAANEAPQARFWWALAVFICLLMWMVLKDLGL